MLLHEALTRAIIGAFYESYNTLRFGFLEAVYARALDRELRDAGLLVEREVPVAVTYKNEVIGSYRADLLVERLILVELKATRLPDPTAERQLLNYLRGSTLEVGLLLHYGPKPSFKRIISTNDS